MIGERDKPERFAGIIGHEAANVHDVPVSESGSDRAATDGAAGLPARGAPDEDSGTDSSGAEIAVPSAAALPLLDPLPDFESTAADCLNRALQIALSLGHASVSSDHLMLALTMDPHARRQLQRVGDIGQLREAAMLRLGRTHWKFAKRGDEPSRFPSPTSDLEEIRKLARGAAADREQKVAIADLVNAFPTKDGRLVYGLKETIESVPAILERIESKLVPRVADFMSRFEAQLRESAERQIEAALRTFAEKELKETVERQRASLEDIGEALKERQAAALEEISNTMQERQLASLEAVGKQIQRDLETLAIVLKHFRERLQMQDREAAPKETPRAAGAPARDG